MAHALADDRVFDDQEYRDAVTGDELSSKYGFMLGHWDQHAMTSPCEAIKEIFDNSIQKAGKDIHPNATPWNATSIQIVQGELSFRRDMTVLFVADNGRGLNREGFIEGFHNRAHSRGNAPRSLQANSISQFGIGSKDADAYLSTDVYYMTDCRKGSTLIGRAGRGLSEALGKGDLRVVHQLIHNSVRKEFLESNGQMDCLAKLKETWAAVGAPVALRLHEIAQLTGQLGQGPFHTPEDPDGLSNALMLCNDWLPLDSSGFLRMLVLRQNKYFFHKQPPPLPLPEIKPDPDGPAAAAQPQLPAAGPVPAAEQLPLELAPAGGPDAVAVTHAQQGAAMGLLYETTHGVTANVVDIAGMLEQNYLFPPKILVQTDFEVAVREAEEAQSLADRLAAERDVLQGQGQAAVDAAAAAAEAQLLAAQATRAAQDALQAEEQAIIADKQARIAVALLPSGYYDHPFDKEQAPYSPTVCIQGQMVNWGNNTLLANLAKFEHSDVIAIPADAEKFGDSGGEPPARVVVTNLAKNLNDRRNAISQSGVAVYVGCRRVCEPEPGPDGQVDNWSLGGLGSARALMEHVKNINSWSVFHSTNKQRTRDLLGPELYKLACTKDEGGRKSIYHGLKSQILIGRGIHVAIVVRPGQLELQQDKKAFLETPQAQALLLAGFRAAIRWVLDNPPSDMLPPKPAARQQRIDLPVPPPDDQDEGMEDGDGDGDMDEDEEPSLVAAPRGKGARGGGGGTSNGNGAASPARRPAAAARAPAAPSRKTVSHKETAALVDRDNSDVNNILERPRVLGQRNKRPAEAPQPEVEREEDDGGGLAGTRSWSSHKHQKTAPKPASPPPPPPKAPEGVVTSMGDLLDKLLAEIEENPGNASKLFNQVKQAVPKRTLTGAVQLKVKSPAWMS